MRQVGNAGHFYHNVLVSSGSSKHEFTATDIYIIETASILAVKILLPNPLLI